MTGETVKNWNIPPKPSNLTLKGYSVALYPLSAEKHGKELFEANKEDRENAIWKYLPYGPFETLESYSDWLKTIENLDDPLFFAIEKKRGQKNMWLSELFPH